MGNQFDLVVAASMAASAVGGGIVGWFIKDGYSRYMNSRDIRLSAKRRALTEALEILFILSCMRTTFDRDYAESSPNAWKEFRQAQAVLFDGMEQCISRYNTAVIEMAAFDPIMSYKLRGAVPQTKSMITILDQAHNVEGLSVTERFGVLWDKDAFKSIHLHALELGKSVGLKRRVEAALFLIENTQFK